MSPGSLGSLRRSPRRRRLRLEPGRRNRPGPRRHSPRQVCPRSTPATERAPATGRPLSDEPVYELCEVATGGHPRLQSGSSFLEACDVAFEFIEENDPAELEIVRIRGEERETVWTYRRSESAAASGAQAPPTSSLST